MAKCGLCRLDRDLKQSHLMPKSLYSALRNAFPEAGKDLVFSRVKSGTSFYTDYQVKKPFLCDCCEGRLSRYGENIVSPECHRGEGKFELLEKIKQATPICIDKTEKWINPTPDDNLNPEAYLYFGASIIWRASAGNWPDGLDAYKNALGDRYQEQIRLYLLGEADFPSKIYLAVCADRDDDIIPLVSFPTFSKKRGYHNHRFYIPGVRFNFIIGSMTGGVEKIYKAHKTNILFVEYSFKITDDFKLFHKKTKCELKPTGRLARKVKSLDHPDF